MKDSKLYGKRKARRDAAVRDFEFQHPLYSQQQIGDAFGLTQPTVSKILHPEKLDKLT